MAGPATSVLARGHRQSPEWHLEGHFSREPMSVVDPCSQASRLCGSRPGLQGPGMLTSI